jgi:hypothetical protein
MRLVVFCLFCAVGLIYLLHRADFSNVFALG